jgi:DNA replication initiation complex subunit (GINS family)
MNERANPSLCEIPADFYISMDGKLAKLFRNSQNLEWIEIANCILERMEFLRKDLAQIRLSKILNSVINNTTIDETVLTWGELRLIKNLRQSIETLGIEDQKILDTQINSPNMDLTEDLNDLASPSLINLVIRILDDVEAFVGLDNKQYGPFLANDIANLPIENAKALIVRGKARAIEVNTDVFISGEKK